MSSLILWVLSYITHKHKTHFIIFFSISADSGKTITEELAEVSHAVVLTNLTSIIAMLGHARDDLVQIESLTRQLQGNATIVSEGKAWR